MRHQSALSARRMRGRYTPSSAHEEAWRRSPEHDRMQMQVFHSLKKTVGMVTKPLHLPASEAVDVTAEWVGIERPIRNKFGTIIAFVDVCRKFQASVDLTRQDGSVYGKKDYYAYDIIETKPRIDSIGGIVRQCYVLQDVCEEAFKSDHEKGFASRILVVVPHDDPALLDLYSASPFKVVAWDMQSGCTASISRVQL